MLLRTLFSTYLHKLCIQTLRIVFTQACCNLGSQRNKSVTAYGMELGEVGFSIQSNNVSFKLLSFYLVARHRFSSVEYQYIVAASFAVISNGDR